VPDFFDLTVDGFWWFERLYGVPRHYTTPTSCISTDRSGSHFIALPQVPYVILMLCSPWWVHCRHAASEFERFLDGVHAAGLEKQLLALTVDCSWSRMVPLCRRFLGKAREVRPIWQDGVNAPGIGLLAYSSLADHWSESSLPGLALGSREDLIEFGKGFGAGAGIARISPAPMNAEDILNWVMQSNIDLFSDLSSISISELQPLAKRDFHHRLLHIREHLEHQHPTAHGCECKTTWRHCAHPAFGIVHSGQTMCHMLVGCPPELEHCQTTKSCGANHATSDKCAPVSSLEDVVGEKLQRHGDEEDSVAALALWLHEIFERHPFELLEDDPKQQRLNVFMDFLRTLCAYFPDHLNGGSSAGEDCRKSICRLGGILETEGLWKKYTEVIAVTVQSSIVTPVADSRKQAFVRRIKWRDLERDWRLCGRPWTEFGKDGWIGCKADNPFARGFPCGAWNLIHAIMAQVARVHDSDLAGQNKTAKELDALRKIRRKEHQLALAKLKAERSRNASLPHLIKLSPLWSRGRRCYYVWGPNKFLNVTRAENATAKVRVDHFHPVDRLQGILVKLGAQKKHDVVEFQLVNDYIRDDDGAIVFKVVTGPAEFKNAQNQSWKLRTVNGVPAHHQDWRVMLRESLTLGKTIIVLEGPIPCNNGTDVPCHAKCAEFKFLENPDPRLTSKYTPVGKLKEQSTGQCLGHLTKPYWIFWATDLGIGLVDCNTASEYRFEEQSFLRNVRFCNTNVAAFPHDCQRIVLHLTFKHHEWVPFVKPRPTLTGVIEPPRVVVKQFRRMISLFWHCQECRHHFHSLQLSSIDSIKHPRDAVLWWWRVHNDINADLKKAKDHVASSPLDPKFPKMPWPSKALCPKCWIPHGSTNRTAAMFNEQEVYHFLVNSFYASKASKRSEIAAETHQAWIRIPHDDRQAIRKNAIGSVALLGFAAVAVTSIAMISVILLRSQNWLACYSSMPLFTRDASSSRHMGTSHDVRFFTPCDGVYTKCASVHNDGDVA